MSTSDNNSYEALTEAAYGGAGGALVTSWKKDAEEAKCCGLIVLPGVLTRLYMARKINEAIRRAQRDALLEAAKGFDARTGVLCPKWVASALRTSAKKIRVKAKEAPRG